MPITRTYPATLLPLLAVLLAGWLLLVGGSDSAGPARVTVTVDDVALRVEVADS